MGFLGTQIKEWKSTDQGITRRDCVCAVRSGYRLVSNGDSQKHANVQLVAETFSCFKFSSRRDHVELPGRVGLALSNNTDAEDSPFERSSQIENFYIESFLKMFAHATGDGIRNLES